MNIFRQIIFWIHLSCGVIGGIVIAIMSFTGVLLAFDTEIIAWAERDIRQAQPPGAGAQPLTLDELISTVSESQPEFHPTSVTVLSDPNAAVVLSAGRDKTLYVNPYSGAASEGTAPRLRAFVDAMLQWHRWLAMDGDNRAVGRAVTGVCNLAFLFLAFSGLYLWWPRKWSWRALKPSVWFMKGYHGKARDFNWHNVIGFWCAPVLIVLTLSGVVMSYRWANNLLYRATGTEPPAQTGSGRGRGGPQVEVPAHPGMALLGENALLAAIQDAEPDWSQITLRLNGVPERERGPRREADSADEPQRAGAINVTVRSELQSPRFASTSLAIDPFTGKVLARQIFDDESPGRRARVWMRYLHTGQALGAAGQFAAGLASLGGVFLVYTGFALSWRRFFPAKSRSDDRYSTKPH